MTNADSLKVTQNEDGSYSLEWDKNDPQLEMVEWVDRGTNSVYD